MHINNKDPALLWHNPNIFLKKVSLKVLSSHAKLLRSFLDWQYTEIYKSVLVNHINSKEISLFSDLYKLSPSFSMWSRSRCVQQETFLMSDKHFENIALHVHWRPAVSPNKDRLLWLKLPGTDLTNYLIGTWI